jgi:NhaA family Na+:H+ antiporter
LKSGIHATLAGVIIAFAIPSRDARDSTRSPLADIEHWLKPWVLFLIMPVFAFANAGVPLTGLKIEDFLAPIPLGIAVGLFVGKQVGVFGFTWLAVRFRLATLPTGLSWRQVYGVSLLAGVGFTMSLFIGSLAFAEPEQQNAVRLGVLVGSALSATAGYLMLRFAVGRTEAKPVLLEPGQPSGLPGSESTQRTGIGHL